MILKHLKEKTTVLHEETEKDNLAKYIIDHSITPVQYQNLLEQNYRAYKTVENLLACNSNQLPDDLKVFSKPVKSEALAQDLKQLGAGLPEVLERPVTHQLAYLVGLAYVIEGSMMGGLLIRKNLESCTNLPAGLKHHFFGKKPQEVLQRWKAFTAAVEEQIFSEAQLAKALAGANFAFTVFKNSAVSA